MIINTDLIYPIGAIYLSVSATNPSILFGGKWEQIKDRFLLAAGDTYAIGTTGGEATHKLTIEEIPKHSHKSTMTRFITNDGSSFSFASGGVNSYSLLSSTSTAITGGDAAHNNMPPYLTVYMWKRVA